jgi:hypothetical protein
MAIIIALIVGRYMSLQSGKDSKRDLNLKKKNRRGHNQGPEV